MNMKMTKGTTVKDDMVHMIELFNEIRIVEVEIDGKTKVNMIVGPYQIPSCSSSLTIYDKMLNVLELMRKLKIAKEIIKDKRGFYLVVKGSSSNSNKKTNNNIIKMETPNKESLRLGKKIAKKMSSASFLVRRVIGKRSAHKEKGKYISFTFS